MECTEHRILSARMSGLLSCPDVADSIGVYTWTVSKKKEKDILSTDEQASVRKYLLSQMLQRLERTGVHHEVWGMTRKHHLADNGVSRYLRLWKSLEREGIQIPTDERLGELAPYPERAAFGWGIEYFSAYRIARGSAPAVARLFARGDNPAVVFLDEPTRQEVENLFSKAWHANMERSLNTFLLMALGGRIAVASFSEDETRQTLGLFGIESVISSLITDK